MITFQRLPLLRGRWFLLALIAPLLSAQVTTINVNNTVLQSTVRRFGINLGAQSFYDSGQLMKNLIFTNPSFEGEIYQSTIHCGSATANSCTDQNTYAGWTSSFWNNASYTMITGPATGRSGKICAFNSNPGVTGGTFTFCDNGGAAPNQGDYMIVRTTQNGILAWESSWLHNAGAGTVTVESADLPPGTTASNPLFSKPRMGPTWRKPPRISIARAGTHSSNSMGNIS